MYLIQFSLIFLFILSSTHANYIWKDTDWVYLENGSEVKQPERTERTEGSGDKYDHNSDRSYGSVKTYTDDTEEDEGSGNWDQHQPYPNVDQEEEEEDDRDTYFESSGESATESDHFHSNNYEPSERSRNGDPISPPVYSTEDPFFEDNRDDISFETPLSTQSTPKMEKGNPSVTGKKTKNKSASFFAQPGIMAAVVGGAVVGLLCAILFVMFIVYRMRKKDEGSYALDEPKRSPTVNSYSKPLSREIYA